MGEKKRQGEVFSEDEYEARTFCVTEKIGAMFLWAGVDCALSCFLNDVDFPADNAEASTFSRSEKKGGNTRFIYPHCRGVNHSKKGVRNFNFFSIFRFFSDFLIFFPIL